MTAVRVADFIEARQIDDPAYQNAVEAADAADLAAVLALADHEGPDRIAELTVRPTIDRLDFLHMGPRRTARRRVDAAAADPRRVAGDRDDRGGDPTHR
jgi:hypothetical protein